MTDHGGVLGSGVALPGRPRDVTLVIAAAGVSLFALALLLVELSWAPLLTADRSVVASVHRFALDHPPFPSAMTAVSNLGSGLSWEIVTVAVVVLLLLRRRWTSALFLGVTVASSSLLNSAVKVWVGRERPVVAHPFVLEPGASFPSGHSQAAAAGFGALLVLTLSLLRLWLRRVAWALAGTAVLAIGFSRVALGVHYPSDVLAGFALGAAWVSLLTMAFVRWVPSWHPATAQSGAASSTGRL